MKNVSPNKSWAAQHFPLLSGAILAPTQALTTLPRSSPGIPLKPSNMGKRKPKVIYEPNSLENVSPNHSWAAQHFPWLSGAILPPSQALPAPSPKPSRHSHEALAAPLRSVLRRSCPAYSAAIPALLVASFSNTQAATSQHSPASGHQQTF